MALKTLTSLIAEARELPTTEAQALWVRGKAKIAHNNRTIRTMENFVPGCEHPAWMMCDVMGNKAMFSFSTDGLDTQGVAGIVMEALTGLNVTEIRALDFSEFRDIARYMNNRQQRTLNALLNCVKDIVRG